ncbi:MAG: fumarylacetoacetate hydrolase family protein [Planctomycetes bacterium]|nr:fumarylacetoacetate hydrolase family protein [Planctomycetota bacterium]
MQAKRPFACVRAVAVAIAVAGGLAAAGCGPIRSDPAAPRVFARFQAGGAVSYGIIEEDKVRRIEGDLFGRWRRTDDVYATKSVKLLPPTKPSKILAMARNYKSHLGEAVAPKVPEAFYKPPSALIGQGESIVIPPGTADVHYEGELVIVIGSRAKNVPKEWALQHVFGVTCGNDVSARDWQKGDIQWWRAKGSDTFAPCGPVISTGINYDDLELQLRVNGETKQRQRTKDMIFGVAEIVSWISRHVTLEPGDLIYTGTPGETTALKPGDTVEVEIEGIGVLVNTVEAAK